MVLPTEAIVIDTPSLFKEVKGYQTVDGVVHGSVDKALEYLRDTTIIEYFNKIQDDPTKFGVSRSMTNNLAEEELAVRLHFEKILEIMLDKGLIK